jgi:hypothetical protein
VTSKLIKCFISLVSPLLLGTFLILISSCGNAKVLANGNVKQAENLGDKMYAAGAPEDMTLAYRLHLHQAQTALQNKKYKVAQQEAQAATDEAERVIKKRDALAADIQERLKALWYVIEHSTFPRKTLVEDCFNAQKAFDKKDYEAAAIIVAEAEANLRLEVRIKERVEVVIKAQPEYLSINKYIPIYEEVNEPGSSSKVIEKIADPIDATFIESKWMSPDLRYVKVSFTIKGVKITGWVEGRFVY